MVGKGTLFYQPRGRLFAPAAVFSPIGERKLAVLTIRASSGAVLKITPFRIPKKVSPFSLEPSDFGVVRDARKKHRGPVACFVFRARLNFSGSGERLYVQCARLTGPNRLVTRLIQGSKFTFFRFNLLVMEDDPPGTRAPSLFVAYERARDFDYSAPEGGSVATHQLILSRLDTASLQQVDWKTGGKGKLTKPLIVTLPTPKVSSFAVATLSLHHLRKSKSVALLLATNTKFVEFKQRARPGGGISIVGEPYDSFKEVYWALYFDKRQKVKTRFIEGDPRSDKASKFGIILTDMDFSENEKCTQLFGFLTTDSIESGPLYIYNTPNPITSKSTDAC